MSEPQLIPVFIPPLVSLLLHAERAKGSPLTEREVLDIRNKGVCMMMSLEHAKELAKKRGYDDLNPERVWVEWQHARVQIGENRDG